MISIDELRKIQLGDLLTITLGFVCLFAPGFLFMFVFFTELAKDLATMKLLLLSGAISTPSFLAILILINVAEIEPEAGDTEEEDQRANVLLALVLSGALLYFSMGVAYYRADVSSFVCTAIVTYAVIAIWVALEGFVERRKRNRTRAKPDAVNSESVAAASHGGS